MAESISSEPISGQTGPPLADVVVLGSLNLDLVAWLNRLPRPGETVFGRSFEEHAGGKGLNQAVAAARAGCRVRMMGCLGADSAGTALREVLRAEGIDDRWVTNSEDLPSGRAMILVDEVAENSIVVVPGANHRIDLTTLNETLFDGATVALAQLEVPVETVTSFMGDAWDRGCLTILNPAPASPLPKELLQKCDVLIPNEGELATLGGAVQMHHLGVRVVLETLGAWGVRCSVADPTTGEPIANWMEPAVKVSPTDTTGAGDVFCGYFAATVARRIAEKSLGHRPVALDLNDYRVAVQIATTAAAIAVTRRGAVASIPYRNEVDQFPSSVR